MPLKATERDVFEFFSKAGKVGKSYRKKLSILMMWHAISILTSFFLQVRDVKLIMDRNSRRSKGVGYVAVLIFSF